MRKWKVVTRLGEGMGRLEVEKEEKNEEEEVGEIEDHENLKS